MFNINRQPIHNYKSTIYIAKKLDSIVDDDLNEIEVYDKPAKYRFNVQTVNSASEIREFGELVTKMVCIHIVERQKYLNKFTEFDKVYINESPDNEIENGYNADYRIYSVRNQNTSIRIYAIKTVK